MSHIITPPTVSESSGNSSTTGTSFLQKVSITLSANTSYLVFYSAEFDVNNSNRPAEVKLELNNTTVLYKYTVPGGTSSVNQWYQFSGRFVIDMGATPTPTIDMDYRMITSFGSDTITIRRAKIIAYEIEVD
jgi:hypothetical protein